MINVVLISDILLKDKILLTPTVFPESPKIGDSIDVRSFTTEPEVVEECLKKHNKIAMGFVNSRSWRMDDDELILMVLLDFQDDDEEDLKPSPAADYFPL